MGDLLSVDRDSDGEPVPKFMVKSRTTKLGPPGEPKAVPGTTPSNANVRVVKQYTYDCRPNFVTNFGPNLGIATVPPVFVQASSYHIPRSKTSENETSVFGAGRVPRVPQTASHHRRGAGGMFTSTQPLPETTETESNDGGDTLWETDMTEQDADYSEAWDTRPEKWPKTAKMAVHS
ncbi:hypothetical protein B0H13DRAFT_1867145 [Mycena leptocephala]|nr:hypothetical protein B0H13DRAFT_1867145 [Mycena leptocephala]